MATKQQRPAFSARRQPTSHAVVCFLMLIVTALGAVAAGPEAAGAPAAGGGFNLSKFLAPFHSVVLHYPIGFITLAAILELFTLRNKSSDLRFAIRLVVGLGALSAIVAALLGWFRGAGGGYETQALEQHRWYGIGVTALIVVAYFVLLAANRTPGQRMLIGIYRLLLAGSLGTLVVAGHLGGNLTHGSNYLFEGAPEFMKSMFGENDSMSTTDPVPSDERTKYYVEQVKPIFEQKCMSCHGEEKQKGGYRLDRKEVAFKGGESGKVAIKPGEPFESNLVRLLLLPPDHDDVMPPAGKSVLTPDELGKVIHWVRTGAAFPEAAAAPAVAPPPR